MAVLGPTSFGADADARAKSTGHDGAIPVRRGPAVHQGHLAGLDQVVYGLGSFGNLRCVANVDTLMVAQFGRVRV